MESSKRIQLLSDTEVEELYARPEFNIHEQHLYFTLTRPEREALTQFRNTRTRIYFLLQLGYFKAKQQFFNFSLDDVNNDIQFILSTYYSESVSLPLTGRISRDYMRIQRQTILSLYDYRDWTSDLVPEIQAHMGDLLRYYPKGHSAFRQALAFFDVEAMARILEDHVKQHFWSVQEEKQDQKYGAVRAGCCVLRSVLVIFEGSSTGPV